MKILMPVLHYYPVIGGLEKWTQEIAEHSAQKAEVFVLTGKVKDKPNQDILNNVYIKRTGLFALKDLSYSSVFYILTTLPFLFFASYKLIKKQKIDILHCQGFLSGLLGFLLKKLTGVRYIITVQSQQKKTLLKKLVYRQADFCIVASTAIEKYFLEIGCKNIKVIPNGVDTARFVNREEKRQEARKELRLTESDFVIITVARLEKIKGIEYLLRAISQMPEVRPRALIVGEGSERKNLEKLAQELDIKEMVKFLGQVENSKVPYYLSAGDCFCLPSLQEGFGIVILEAMACGLPVIASNVGGIVDIIENNKTGILVAPKNPEELTKAIEEIRQSKPFVEMLKTNSKQLLSKYNWQNISEQVLQIYENIVSK